VIVTGGTSSLSWPVSDDAYCRENKGFMDVFVTALDPTGSKIAFSTLIGGEKEEWGYGICLDDTENIYITGSTISKDYPKVIGNKTPASEYDLDVLITVFNQTCAELIYSTVVGGGTAAMWSPNDEGKAIIPTGEKEVVIAGMTSCSDFPTTKNATDTVVGGGSDLFFSIFDLCSFPEDPREISIEQGNSYLNISWEEPSDDGGRPILGYNVYRGNMESLIEYYADAIDIQFFNDTDIEIGRTYYYFVRAYSQVGEGKPSSIVHSLAISAPSVPQFFQVQPSNGWIKVSWETPVFDGAVSILGYRIYRSDRTDGSTEVFEIPAVDLDLHDSEVVNGHNYTYSATAWNRIGESDHTTEIWGIPKGESDAPIDLNVRNGSGFAVLTWSPPEYDGGSPILYYRVYQGSMVGEDIVWRYVDTPETSFNDTLAEVGRKYLYYVTAVNSEGESIPSNMVEAIPRSIPSPPENVQASEGNGYVALSWDAPSDLGGIDLEGYRIYRTDGDHERLMLVEVGLGTRIYKDKGLVNGKKYSYWISAFNSHGESDHSEKVDATPGKVPEAPTSVAAEAQGEKVIITWAAPANNGGAPILDYTILRRIIGGDPEPVGTAGSGEPSYTDEESEAGTEYFYAVKARNRMGYSAESEEAEVTALGPPGPPENLDTASGDGYVEITWSTPLFTGGSPVTGFTVERSDPQMEALLIVAELGPQEVYYKDETVENGEEYIYRITAVNGIGSTYSSWSDIASPLGIPGAPSGISIENGGSDIIIRWIAPDQDGGCCIQVYRIYRTSEEGETELIGVVEGTTSEFSDKDEKEPGTYTYHVIAVNSVGEGGMSEGSEVKVDSEDEGSFVSEHMELLITLPIIILLLIILLLLMIRRKGPASEEGPGPQPTPVADDPNGYLNGYEQQALYSNGDYDQPNAPGYDSEQ
jgi:titin